MRFLLENIGPLLLMAAAVGWYLCVMIATVALTNHHDTPGSRAKAAWLCNLPVVLLAVAVGRYEIAVGMIFATSVACMTLVLGIVTFAAGSTTAQPSRRAWGMLLPVSLVCMLIGLSGGFDAKDAVILIAQGVAAYWMWLEPSGNAAHRGAGPVPAGKGIILLGVVIAATLAGAAAVLAATTMSPRMGLMNGGLVTALMLAPAMALPLIGLGLQAVHEGRYDDFVGGLMGFVFLNLCLLLPMATLLWMAQPPRRAEAFNMDPTTAPATIPASVPASRPATGADEADEAPPIPRVLPYPMAVWRVDTVLLIAVGLLLLPVSLGRWSLGRIEGIGLILTWAVFMLLTVIATLTNRL